MMFSSSTRMFCFDKRFTNCSYSAALLTFPHHLPFKLHCAVALLAATFTTARCLAQQLSPQCVALPAATLTTVRCLAGSNSHHSALPCWQQLSPQRVALPQQLSPQCVALLAATFTTVRCRQQLSPQCVALLAATFTTVRCRQQLSPRCVSSLTASCRRQRTSRSFSVVKEVVETFPAVHR